MNIPFENLDVMDEIPIILETNRLYNKMIEQNRGGFCFELNGVYNRLLRELGFDAYLIGGSIAKDDGSWHIMNTHAANIVLVGGNRYLSDVGIGDSSDIPLPLSGDIIERWNGHFRVLDGQDGYYYVQQNNGEGWENQYRFKNIYRSLAFFQPYCDHLQTDPNSNFKQGNKVTISRPEGRVTLSDEHITMTNVDGKEKKSYDCADFGKLLDQYFGIIDRE